MEFVESIATPTMDKVIPFYLPVLDVASRHVVAYECLARVLEEGQTLNKPADKLFLLPRHALKFDVTKQLFSICAEFFRNQNIGWHINLSADNLHDELLAEYIFSYLSYYPHPERVTFELLEEDALSDCDGYLKFCHRCHKTGMRVFLDDVSHTKLPKAIVNASDGLKLDARLIRSLARHNRTGDRVSSLCTRSLQQGLEVVAEMIENESQLDALVGVGVRFGQGGILSEISVH